MLKKQFRISLSEGATRLCETLATMAAYGNGGRPVTIENLKLVADANLIEYPTINEGCTVEPIGQNALYIERKIGAEYKNILKIELIEVMEPELPEEEN